MSRLNDRAVLITGAAGNLGSLLARHLAPSGRPLRLMFHRRPLADDLTRHVHVTAVRADLGEPRSLADSLRDVHAVVHFAGVLFAPRPERFLPETNTRYFSNLLDAALDEGVERVILISFPHVEGRTSLEQPATGRTDRQPISVHARTRLEEERILLKRTKGTRTTPVVLRLGMVYGRGVLMIDAARWLAKRRLLCVWREPTLMQILSTADFLKATEAAIYKSETAGIYHVGDEEPVTLQHFLDQACRVWGCARPLRVPFSAIYVAAALCELVASVARTKSPLTRDFVKLGRVSHWGDTGRARKELIPRLEYPTLADGLATL